MTTISGREPHIVSPRRKQGESRLSANRLASMLTTVAPNIVSLDAARAMLNHSDFYVRFGAAEMLSRRGDRDARLIMQDVLMNGDPPARASVARHLSGFTWFAAEPLLRQALADPDPRVQEAAIHALCGIGDLNTYPLLVEILSATSNDDLRLAAAWALRDKDDPAAVPVLAAVLEARDPDVRVKGLETLAANESPEAVQVARNALNDPDSDVRYAATLTLLELLGESWLTELAGIIGRTHGEIRLSVLRGMFHATNYLRLNLDQTAEIDLLIDALETAILDDLAETRLAAVWPLSWIQHPRSPAILRRAYFLESDSHVKGQMIRISVSLASEIGDDLLADGLKSPSPEIRSVAEEMRERVRLSGAANSLTPPAR
jgi:hypothetical protein